jgi:2-polyprenyl-3-methyl-5-hydroxy-6-metoxy-1,4-benzoquinol methylase
MDPHAHWDNVYSSKAEDAVSWFTRNPTLSMQLIRQVSPGTQGRIIDVGGGASVLVDKLLDDGFQSVAVLDISEAALNRSKQRLGERAGGVRWIVADVTAMEDAGQFDVWHDRAVFHFLTEPGDQELYVQAARRTVPIGGHLIISTFALGGPQRCSGLNVCQYDAQSLAAVLGGDFTLLRERSETHLTPAGKTQAFIYAVFTRV